MSAAIDLKPLSKRARALCGIWFGMMRVGSEHSGLTLHLQESKPSPETQAALDELVAAGVISVAPFNKFGGLVYRPLVNCHDAFVWMSRHANDPELKFRLMVPVGAKKARA